MNVALIGTVFSVALAWLYLMRRAGERCATFARTHAARIEARREVLRAWHWNNTPIDIRD